MNNGWDLNSSSEDDDNDENVPCIRSYMNESFKEAMRRKEFGPDWPEEILRQWERSGLGGGASSFRYQQELSAMNDKLDGIRHEIHQALGLPNNNHQPSHTNEVSEYSFNDTFY